MALSTGGTGIKLGFGAGGGPLFFSQPSAVELTTSATLTVDQLAVRLFTCNAGTTAAVTYTLPTGAAMDAAFLNMAAESEPQGFDISFTNISTNASEDATIAPGTGFTIKGNAVIASNAAATDQSAATFRAVRTGDSTWVLYRIG